MNYTLDLSTLTDSSDLDEDHVNVSSFHDAWQVNTTTISTIVTQSLQLDNGLQGGYPGSITTSKCEEWISPQHVIVQLACLLLAVGFGLPHTYNNHVLISRGSLALGSFLMVMWGAVIICQLDTIIWGGIICLINLVHCALWGLKHWPDSNSNELDIIYSKLFKPLQVTRQEFKDLCSIRSIRELPDGAVYAMEESTQIGERVSFLLSGRLKISHENIFLHTIEPTHFVDSIEFDGKLEEPSDGPKPVYQVTIRAIEHCRLCVFDVEVLEQFLLENRFISNVFSTLLGKDITHKLHQVQEMLLSNFYRPDFGK